MDSHTHMYDFLYNIIIYVDNNFQNLNLLKTNNRYMIAIEISLDLYHCI